MVGLELGGQREGVGVDLVLEQLEAGVELGQDRVLGLGKAPTGDLILDRPGGVGVPLEPKRRVDGHKGVAYLARAGDDDDHAGVGAAGDQPLADARELLGTAGVDAPGTGAVLAWHRADPGVDTEAAKRALDDAGRAREALLGPGNRPLVGAGPGDRQRAFVKDGGATAGKADDGFEAGVACGADGAGEAVGDSVLLGKCKLARGSVKTEGRRQLTGGNAPQDRVGNGRSERWPVWESLPEQA